MIDSILDIVTKTLNDGGLTAFREFPPQLGRAHELCVSVGLGDCTVCNPGMGSYLGTQVEEDGREVELFGKRLELVLEFEVFSPFDEQFGAEACVQGADMLRSIIPSLPAGIKTIELNCDAVQADEELEAFRCRCLMKCFAFLVAEAEDEPEQFLDFVLKGVVDGVN